MNEEIQARLLKYLDGFEGATEKALDFTAEQMPLYLQELCQYTIYSGIAELMTCGMIGIVLYVAMLFAVKVAKDDAKHNDHNTNGWYIFGHFLWALLALPLFSICIEPASQVIKAYAAPRVFIVEHITKLAKDK